MIFFFFPNKINVHFQGEGSNALNTGRRERGMREESILSERLERDNLRQVDVFFFFVLFFRCFGGGSMSQLLSER